MNRQETMVRTFVELADTLVADFDVLDVMHTLCENAVDMLSANAAAIILADPRGRLEVVAATTHNATVLELFALQISEGPCLDAFERGEQVVNVSTVEAAHRWPRFTAASHEAGFLITHALPMRLRDQRIGVLALFCDHENHLGDEDRAVGQALADVATIGLLQERAISEREVLAEQLQTALNSRILVEQAKGVLAERLGVDVAAAFEMMRAHSRRTRRRLTEIAAEVIQGVIDGKELHTT